MGQKEPSGQRIETFPGEGQYLPAPQIVGSKGLCGVHQDPINLLIVHVCEGGQITGHVVALLTSRFGQ